MGASNFYFKNARALYPLFTDIPEDEQDLFDYTEEGYNIAEYLDELVSLDSVEFEYIGDNRSYPETSLGHKQLSYTFGDFTLYVKIQPVMRAGYYEGACLDYNIIKYRDNNGYEFDSIEDISVDSYYSDMNAGLCAIAQVRAQRMARILTDKLTDSMEEAFAKIATPYKLIGRASNGETFYEKV
jgi:hypothetical protein